MRNIISLIAAILLTFLAIALLMASIQYSSDLIGVKVQNVTILPTSVEINGSSNSTGGNAPESGGDSQPVPRGGGNSGLNAINMSSLSFMSGGNPKVPDLKDPDNLLLFIIIIILLLITLALIGYIIWRRRHSKKAPPESKVVVAPKLPEYVEGDYRIKFTQICKPFPAVWGEGEPLDIVVEGKEGAISPVVLEIDGEGLRAVHLD
jgi:flagellar basal body-associated protein FliL